MKPCLKAKVLLATCSWFLLEQWRLEPAVEGLGVCGGSENVADASFPGEELTWSPCWVAGMEPASQLSLESLVLMITSKNDVKKAAAK